MDAVTGLEDAERLRGELRSFLGVDADLVAPTTELISTVREDGFARHLVHLVTDDDRMPVFLAVRDGDGSFPAVVVFHQHAGQRHFGKSEVFGMAGDRFQAVRTCARSVGFRRLVP